MEKESGETLKILRTDNGGEFTSSEFEAYLKTKECVMNLPYQSLQNKMVLQSI